MSAWEESNKYISIYFKLSTTRLFAKLSYSSATKLSGG